MDALATESVLEVKKSSVLCFCGFQSILVVAPCPEEFVIRDSIFTNLPKNAHLRRLGPNSRTRFPEQAHQVEAPEGCHRAPLLYRDRESDMGELFPCWCCSRALAAFQFLPDLKTHDVAAT